MTTLADLGLTIEDIAPSLVQALGAAQLQSILSQVALLKSQQPPPPAATKEPTPLNRKEAASEAG